MTTDLDEMNMAARGGFSGRLGLTFTDLDRETGRLSADWVVNERLRDAHGDLTHGAISSVVETIASFAAQAANRNEGTVVGVSNCTDFCASTNRSPLSVAAAALDQTADQQLWEVHIVDPDQTLIAHGKVRLQNLNS